jgi:hypothetical protein
VGKDKVLLLTIVDRDTLPIEDDCFIMATTTASVHTNFNPSITLEMTSKLESKEYTSATNEPDTHGESISGILKRPLWFIRKFKSLMEQMYG